MTLVNITQLENNMNRNKTLDYRESEVTSLISLKQNHKH